MIYAHNAFNDGDYQQLVIKTENKNCVTLVTCCRYPKNMQFIATHRKNVLTRKSTLALSESESFPCCRLDCKTL